MKRALLMVGGACKNLCDGCPTARQRGRRASREEVHAALRRLAAAGFEAVTLGGGEPTLRRALPGWIAAAHGLGLEVTLRTNGRLLAYRGVAAGLAARGLTAFEVKLPAADAATHGAVTHADGLSQTLQGLTAAARVSPVRVRCPLSKETATAARLVALVDAVAERRSAPRPSPAPTLVLALEGAPGEAPLPPWEATRRAVDAAVRRGRDRGVRVVHEGLPLCLLPGHEALTVAPEGDGVVMTLWADTGAARWSGEDSGEDGGEDRGPTPWACHACALEPRCPGAPPGWTRHVQPRPGLRSNSFHYAPAGPALPWPEGAPCPALSLDTALRDPARGLFVRQGADLRWHATSSGDFSRAALWETLHERGQVYRDVSAKAAADDFARDLAPLTPAAACAACARRAPEGPTCPGAYRALPPGSAGQPDVFTRDDAAVRDVLGTLRGDVLDVGCGHGPYTDSLAAHVEAGAVRYRGVDPDGAALERLRARWPGLHLTEGTAEDLDLAPGSLDAALVLRSYNHLREPGAVLAHLTRALRPGGGLLLVDNVAFGLVRTAAQVARAEAGPGAFEHYRNASAAQAKEQVARATPAGSLRLVDERRVGPGTSNQWLLRYVRVAVTRRAGGSRAAPTEATGAQGLPSPAEASAETG